MNTSARSGDLRQFVLALPALVLALSLYSRFVGSIVYLLVMALMFAVDYVKHGGRLETWRECGFDPWRPKP